MVPIIISMEKPQEGKAQIMAAREEAKDLEGMIQAIPAPDCKPSRRPLGLASFHVFSNLPPEIQHHIWNQTVLPRVVHVRWNRRRRQLVSPDYPAILHVSRNARSCGQRFYKKAFGAANATGEIPLATVYFNYEVDTVSFAWSSFDYTLDRGAGTSIISGKLTNEDYAGIRSIAIDERQFKIHEEDSMHLFGQFAALEELRIEKCPGKEMVEADAERCRAKISEAFNVFNAEVARFYEGSLPSFASVPRPKAVCSTNGDRCSVHWWFKDWEKLLVLNVAAWGWHRCFSTVSYVAWQLIEDERVTETENAIRDRQRLRVSPTIEPRDGKRPGE